MPSDDAAFAALKWKVNDRVLVFYSKNDGYAYPAKIIKVDKNNEGIWIYRVHFDKWNDRWDKDYTQEAAEDETLFLSWNEDLAAEHANLYKQHLDMEKGKKSSDKRKSLNTSDRSTPTQKRRREDDDIPNIERIPVVDRLSMTMPDSLRAILMDDCDAITKRNMLWKVPCNFTVDYMVEEFGKHIKTGLRQTVGPTKEATEYNIGEAIEVTLGVVDYFNSTCSMQLLYKQEKGHFEQYCEKGDEGIGGPVNVEDTPECENLKVRPSSIYGLAHLLRLFLRFGPMLAHTQWTERSINSILAVMSEFMVWLDGKRGTFYNFNNDYVPATPAQIRDTFNI